MIKDIDEMVVQDEPNPTEEFLAKKARIEAAKAKAEEN